MVTPEQRLQSLETWADAVMGAIRALHEDNQAAHKDILDRLEDNQAAHKDMLEDNQAAHKDILNLIVEVTRLLQSHSVDLASIKAILDPE